MLPSTVSKFIFIFWILSFILALPFAFTISAARMSFKKYVPSIFHTIITLLSSVSYILFGINITHKTKKLGRINSNAKGERKNLKFHLVSFAMFISFFLCYQIPEYIVHDLKIGRMLNIIGYVLDPCIYIFLQPGLRETAWLIISCNIKLLQSQRYIIIASSSRSRKTGNASHVRGKKRSVNCPPIELRNHHNIESGNDETLDDEEDFDEYDDYERNNRSRWHTIGAGETLCMMSHFSELRLRSQSCFENVSHDR